MDDEEVGSERERPVGEGEETEVEAGLTVTSSAPVCVKTCQK